MKKVLKITFKFINGFFLVTDILTSAVLIAYELVNPEKKKEFYFK